MIFAIFAILLIAIVLILIFRDSKIMSDIRTDYSRKTKPPSRTPIIMKQSQPTTPYEFAFADPKNFSQPRDGKLDQYDFNLPALPHRPSTYFASNAFLVNKRVKTNAPLQQPLSDASIVENHRFYYQNRQKQKLSNTKKESAKIPSNYDVYKSANQFYNNVFPTSLDQILSSAKNPHVLPAIVEKKVTETKASPTISRTPSTTLSTTSTLPPPPPSITTPKFTFNFQLPK